MTHPTIEAMARAYVGALVADGSSPVIHCEPDADEIAAMLAALRALAACEPPKGALLTLGLLSAAGPLKRADYVEAWRVMLAELVEECERDA